VLIENRKRGIQLPARVRINNPIVAKFGMINSRLGETVGL